MFRSYSSMRLSREAKGINKEKYRKNFDSIFRKKPKPPTKKDNTKN